MWDMPFRSKSDMVPVTPGVNNLTSAHDALFVYGSLLSNYVPKGPNPIVPPSTLRAAKLIGPATLRGFQLCDLGRYPCIVPVSVRCSSLNKSKEEEGMDAYVSGELYELNVNNAECWKVLDAYEGISKQYAEPYEYRREKTVTVELNGGHERRTAETYVYNLDDGDKLERIATGNYIAFYNAKHGK